MTAVSNYKNKFLAGLSVDDAALLLPLLSHVDLAVRKSLEPCNHLISCAYFLESGLASVVATGSSDHNIEVAFIGCEGMTGVAIVLAADRSPHETFVQSAGDGWRINADALTRAMAESETLRNRLLLYAHTLTVQMGLTALANGRYKLEERLARWLLMAHDRSEGDDVVLTHEFLAIMLGSRRPGVTTALSQLEKSGMIEAQRGIVIVRDRDGLEETAKGSYGAAEAEYKRVFA